MKMAISRLTIESSSVEGFDRVACEKELTAIKNSLNTFRTIKTAANNIVAESNKILTQVDQVKSEISSSLENLNQLLESAESNTSG